jgi:hypothetical protein
MTHVPSRPNILEGAALQLRAKFGWAEERLKFWKGYNGEQRRVNTVLMNKMVYECTPVLRIMEKLSDNAAKHMVKSWPEFVKAWNEQRIDEAHGIMLNDLLNYVGFLIGH